MSRLFLVGYGTLLYRASLGHTIGGDAADDKPMTPVRVAGYRRLFNLRPDHYEPSFRLSTEPIEAAAMNVEPADDAEFNGLAFEVTADELAALDQRERFYRRVACTVEHFATGEIVGEGHFYSSDLDARWIERDPAKLLPLWRDIDYARRGAYSISQAFGRTYDRTTFLADGTTLMVDHYADHLDTS